MRDFDQLLLRGEFTSSTFDFFALLLFIAFAVIYLIAPALGYQAESRTKIANGLYVLVAYACLSLFQTVIFWMEMSDRFVPPGHTPFLRALLQAITRTITGENGFLIYFVIAVIKMTLLLAAMFTFVSGLRSLRLRRPKMADSVEQAPQGTTPIRPGL